MTTKMQSLCFSPALAYKYRQLYAPPFGHASFEPPESLSHEPRNPMKPNPESKKVLLTSVCRPLGPEYGDAPSVGYELLYRQVALAQGIFSPRTVNIQYSLEYIAENLDTPTVVLQYPSKREFIKELKKGYDYVGISFLMAIFHKVEGHGRLGPQARAQHQDHPRRLRHDSERRRAGTLRRLHLPRGRGRLHAPVAGRAGNSRCRTSIR